MIEVYSKCNTCGVEGLKIRQISKYAQQNGLELVVNKSNSRYAPELTQEHLEYLRVANIESMALPGIVIIDGEVSLLKLWQPS